MRFSLKRAICLVLCISQFCCHAQTTPPDGQPKIYLITSFGSLRSPHIP